MQNQIINTFLHLVLTLSINIANLIFPIDEAMLKH